MSFSLAIPTTPPLVSLTLLLFLFSQESLSVDPTLGPQAPVSIASETAYSNARPCANTCIVYQGMWRCGLNAGYGDLPFALGCGCSPKNYCLCSTNLAPSASSYISSCVSAGCSKFGNVDSNVSSMVGLYDGYCATANKAVSTAATTTTSAKLSDLSTDASSANPGSGVSTSQVDATTTATGSSSQVPAPSSSASADGDNSEDGGLSKSDIIALASGLGVGVPSLIIAAVALWWQMRRKREGNRITLEMRPRPTGPYTHVQSVAPSPAATPPPPQNQAWGRPQVPFEGQPMDGQAGTGPQGYTHGGGGQYRPDIEGGQAQDAGGGQQWPQAYELASQEQNTRGYR